MKNKTVPTILKAIALAMGIAVIVLSILGNLASSTASLMLGMGLAALAINSFQK